MVKLQFRRAEQYDVSGLDLIIGGRLSDEEKEEFRKRLDERRSAVFMLIGEEGPAAVSAMVFDAGDEELTEALRRLYLSHLFVREDLKDKGYDGMMLEYTVNQANYMGYDYLTCKVMLDRPEELKLFTDHGFTSVIRTCIDENGSFVKLCRDVRIKIKCCGS